MKRVPDEGNMTDSLPIDRPETAYAQLLESKRALDDATLKVDEARKTRRDSVGEEFKVEDPFAPDQPAAIEAVTGKHRACVGKGRAFPMAQEIERVRRERYQLSLTTYLEAKRLSEAKTSARTTLAITLLTGVIAVATVVQVALTVLPTRHH